VQVVPAIAPEVKHLTVFQRTPIWLAPKWDKVFDSKKIKSWEQYPFLYKLNQYRVALMIQSGTWAMQNYFLLKPFWRFFSEIPPAYNLNQQVKDLELRKKLTPTYALGCKRPAVSSDYFKTFTRNNVSLVTEGIESVTENGILTKDGKEILLDIIIYSTGFKTTEKGNFPNFKVVGTGSDELSDYWEKNKYQSFEGVSVPGYPNFFLTSGPFTFGLNWFSMLEDNVHLIIRLLTKAKEENATLIDVNQKAHEEHYKTLQNRASKGVQVSSACAKSNSYYIDSNGEFSLGAVFSPFYRWIKVRITNLKGFEFK
jgi:cation diffusion facilitator CzcD-associated flavoprotein CzcO